MTPYQEANYNSSLNIESLSGGPEKYDFKPKDTEAHLLHSRGHRRLNIEWLLKNKLLRPTDNPYNDGYEQDFTNTDEDLYGVFHG